MWLAGGPETGVQPSEGAEGMCNARDESEAERGVGVAPKALN